MMRKGVERETAEKEKGRKAAETGTAGDKWSLHRPAPGLEFDPGTLLNSSGGMVFTASPDYRIEYMNEAARRKIGRDLTGKPCFKVFYGFDERCPWCRGELVMKGETIRQEILNPIDNRWYSSVLTPLQRKDGSIGLQSLVFDITEQKKSEAVLGQNEALLRSIHQAAPMGIGMVKNRVMDWTNGEISRMTGYTAEELKGQSSRILYPSDEEFDRVGRHKYAEIHSKGSGSIVTVWRRKDGQPIHVYLSSTPIDPHDLPAGVVFTALDITEKKKAQDELWISEEKYRALFENAVMGIFQSTPAGRFISVNPATAKMCGYASPEEMIATVTDIASCHYVDPAERDLFVRTIEKQGFVRNFEHRTRRKDGSVFWVSVNARAVKDRRGTTIFYEGTHEDIQWRKESEEALRQSEERFAKSFRLNPVPVAISSIDEGRYIDVNDRFVETFGFSRGEIIGRTSTELNLWGIAEGRDRVIKKLGETGSIKNLLHDYKTKSGQIRTGLWAAEVIRLGDRDVLLSILHDITERKHAEEKYQSILAEIDEFYYEIDLQGNLIFFNDAACSIIGYSREELQGKNNRDYTSPETAARMYRVFNSVYRTGRKARLSDYEVIHKNGARRVLEISAALKRDEKGNPAGFRGLGCDVTDRVKAEEALRLSEERYRTIYENSLVGIFQSTPEGCYISVNPAFARIYGYESPEDVISFITDIGTQIFVDQEDRKRCLAILQETGILERFETQMRRKDGSIIWTAINSRIVCDPKGQPLFIEGVIEDITERKHAEAERARLEQQLRQAQKTEAIGTLAGGIAHDFNNILFAVIGYAELCLQDVHDEESRWNLSQILSASNRAKTLVNQILTFSRQVEQERRPLNVIPLAKEALKFLRSSLPSTIDLRLDTGAGESIVLADAAQIHQVIMNLCTNASHAMRTSGGRLSVVIDNAHPPADLIKADGNGIRPEVFVRLSVSDTGHGIEPDQLERIFDPFFTTKAPGEGTGLGLSVVYGIAKSLGGAVHVDSTPGRGSTFDVYFPAIASMQKEPQKSAEPLPRGSESILFVDDEAHLVEVMGQMLSALGYRVTTVMESPKALKLFRENPGCFDLVMTDMTMPHMTGAELAREIFRIRPDMPIILCTGYSELIGEEDARRMGIRRFLMKPLFMGDVAKEIRAVLAEKGRSPQS